MLIEHYDFDVFTPPCEPGAERFLAIAGLTVDISEVLPYLNATLRGLVASQKKLADCPPLPESAYAEKLAALQAIIIDAPAIG